MMRQAQATSQETATQVDRAARQIEGITFRLNSFGQTALATLTSLGVSLSAIGTARSAVQMAADAEQMQISFETMLGSAEAGRRMVEDLQRFAAATPLDMPTIQRATQLLMQFGVEGDEVIGILRQLGDVTGGEASKMMSMALAFGQMSSTGRLMGGDLNQMINAGFNPLQEMARTTGQSMAFLKEEMERGRISLQMVRDALTSASGAGGRFAGLMEKQSQSFSGLLSTMQDDIGGFMRTLGKDLIEGLGLKAIIRGVSAAAQELTGWLQSLSPEIKRVASIIGIATLAAGGLLAGFVALELFMAPLMAGIAGVGASLLGLIGPVGLVAAAVGTITAAFVHKSGGMVGAWERIKTGAAVAWEYVKDRVEAFVEWFRPTFNVVKMVVVNFGEIAAAVWDKTVEGAMALADAISPLIGTVKDAASATLSWLTEFVSENRDAIGSVGLMTAAVGVAVVAYKAMEVVLGIVSGIMAILKIQQIAGAALWAAYSAATIGAKVAMWLLNAATTAFTAIASGAALAGAVTAMVSFGTSLAAALATALLLAPALIAVGAAIYGAFEAGKGLFGALASLPTATGPIGDITAMFRQWGGLLGEIVEMAQTNMPRAWEMTKAAAALAVAQIKQLWPPLWEYIKSTASALWDFTAKRFETAMKQAFYRIIAEILPVVGLQIGSQLFDMEAIKRNQGAAVDLELQLAEALKAYNAARATGTSQEIKDAEERLREIRERASVIANEVSPFDPLMDLAELEDWQLDILFPPGIAAQAQAQGQMIGQHLNKGLEKEAHKFGGFLAGSAEDVDRLAAHLDMLNEVTRTAAHGMPAAVVASVAAPVAAAAAAAQEAGGLLHLPFTPVGQPMEPASDGSYRGEVDDRDLWQRMVDLLTVIAGKDPVTLEDAGVT